MAVARFDMGLTGNDDRKALKKYVHEIDQTVERQPGDPASTDGTVRRPHPTGAGVELMENEKTINPLSDWVRIESEEHGRSYCFNTLTRDSSWSDPRVSDGQQLAQHTPPDMSVEEIRSMLVAHFANQPYAVQILHEENDGAVLRNIANDEGIALIRPHKNSGESGALQADAQQGDPRQLPILPTPSPRRRVPIRELKEQLDQLGVDHSHCIERAELEKLLLDQDAATPATAPNHGSQRQHSAATDTGSTGDVSDGQQLAQHMPPDMSVEEIRSMLVVHFANQPDVLQILHEENDVAVLRGIAIDERVIL